MSKLSTIAGEVDTQEQTFQTDPTGPVELAPADPRRYAIGFSTPSLGTVIVTTNPSDPLTGGLLTPNAGIQWFTVKDHGSFPQKAWYATVNLLILNVTVWTVTIPKE